jgi:RHS repeat-associated protein
LVPLTNQKNICKTYTYDPWGNIISEEGTSTLKNPFTYKGAYGYYYDEETGLYYLKARYYELKIYRFLTRDPIEKAPELADLQNPLSLNPYVYCEDDPVGKVDPDGLAFAATTGGGIVNITRGFLKLLKRHARIARKKARKWKRAYQLPLKLYWFFKKVRSGGPWDLKRKHRGRYKFLGRTLKGEDLGNIHYGYVGAAARISRRLLLAAAGAYQVFSRTTRLRWFRSYFDDPRDQRMIKWGIRLYYKYGC